jgi:hypothetical protein
VTFPVFVLKKRINDCWFTSNFGRLTPKISIFVGLYINKYILCTYIIPTVVDSFSIFVVKFPQPGLQGVRHVSLALLGLRLSQRVGQGAQRAQHGAFSRRFGEKILDNEDANLW